MNWKKYKVKEGQYGPIYRVAPGVTVRKTIDVLIGTFCAEHGLQLIHHDSDFDLMAKHIGLDMI